MSEISGVTAIADKFPKHAVNACQRSILPQRTLASIGPPLKFCVACRKHPVR
jgi:hypothetical protein